MGDNWKNEADIFSVQLLDKVMYFRLNKSREIEPSKAPILMLLHGHGSTIPSRFKHPQWNSIAPIDNFGCEQLGSWWLGEHDTTTLQLLDLVIESSLKSLHIRDGEERLFIYGSSMGGYGALLHGVRYNAVAIYANVPQVQLLGTTYSEGGMKKYFKEVISPVNEKYNNLCLHLSTFNTHPLYFICENRFGYVNYKKEHTSKLISLLDQLDLNYHLEIIPTKGHNKNRGINDVREFFEQYCIED